MKNTYSRTQLLDAIEQATKEMTMIPGELVLGPEWADVVDVEWLAGLRVVWTVAEQGAWLRPAAPNNRGGAVALDFDFIRTGEVTAYLKEHAMMCPTVGNCVYVKVAMDEEPARFLRKQWGENNYHFNVELGDFILRVADSDWTLCVHADSPLYWKQGSQPARQIASDLYAAGYQVGLGVMRKELARRKRDFDRYIATYDALDRLIHPTVGKLRHWMVCGRIPGDDDDSMEYVTTVGDEDPTDAFTLMMYDGSARLAEDWREREPNQSENPHGEWVYVNKTVEINGPPIKEMTDIEKLEGAGE